MGNTQDSSGVILRAKPEEFISDLSSVLLVNTDGRWFDWFVLLLPYKLSSCISPLPCSLSKKPERSAEQLLTADVSYYWLYPSKQAVDRFMLFVCLDRVLFSRLKCSVEQILTADLSAHTDSAGRLLIGRSMNNITGPTNTRTEPGYKLNCTWRGMVGGVRD